MSGRISPEDCPFGEDHTVVTSSVGYDNKQTLLAENHKKSTYYGLTTDSLKHDGSKDIYSLIIEQFWVEFIGVSSSKSRPVPFVESFPVVLWITQPLLPHSMSRSSSSTTCSAKSESNSGVEGMERKHRKLLKQYYSTSDEDEFVYNEESSSHRNSGDTLRLQKQETADLHLIAKVGSKVNIQLNHYQFLFLMRLVERVVQFQTDMEQDTVAILQSTTEVFEIQIFRIWMIFEGFYLIFSFCIFL